MKKSLPIVVNSSTWSIQEKSLAKNFSFEKNKHSEYFVFELLKFLRKTVADVEFRKRSNSVIVVIRSLSPYISEIEKDASQAIDDIYEDIKYCFRKEQD